VKPFDLAFHHATEHGVLAAVQLPDSPEPVPEAVMAQLHPGEAEMARGLRAYRQVSFVGGRLALRLACQQLGFQPGPVLADDRGAPGLPEGITGSISHKRTLAVAMVGPAHGTTLGIDLEDYGPPRPGIAQRVLTPAELELVQELEGERQWVATLLRFSLKESVYKALDPWVRRYVGFQEAEVVPDTDGLAHVSLNLEGGEGPFVVNARYNWLHGRLLTSVRIGPAAESTV
jgi:4'-phosphopantetheinyl transferase EntD